MNKRAIGLPKVPVINDQQRKNRLNRLRQKLQCRNAPDTRKNTLGLFFLLYDSIFNITFSYNTYRSYVYCFSLWHRRCIE